MAKQRFQLQFDFEGNIGPIKSSVAELQKSLAGIALPANLSANFEKLFGKLETEMSEFQAMTKNGFASMADVGKAQTAFSRISKLMNQIGLEANKVKGLDPNKLIPKEAQTRVEGVTKKLKELQAQQSKKDSYVEAIKKQTEAIEKQKNALEGLKASRRALSKENSTLGAAKGAQVTKKEGAEKEKTSVLKRMEELEGTKGGKSSAEYKNLGQELTQLNGIIRDCDKEIARLTTQITKNKASMANLDGEVESSETALTSLRDKLTEMQKVQVSPEGLLELRKELAELLNVNIDEVSTDLKEIETAIDSINSEEIKKVSKNIQDLGNKTNKTDDALDKAAQGMRDFDRSAQNLDRASQDMENLKNQVLQFFSLTNSVQLFKRAVMSALDTVKELDATMTEAAVVTEFDVGDMWDKLPEYSANAQKLGVSINGMYQATTLYYQQGLKTNEAMQVGIETMKMAKIAGMDSAEATEAMTAALRGFNMELNETSATRVNDVYSQLAAVTAADTEQIATAMSKTASIAASANMEFETTAALLAQIIETTQEAPETAGTAMKTIIARFAEVKNLRDQGKSTGTDSEGEGIDVNKIQTALRTVGISMDGFFAGTEGLDSILLKLSEKWDTLDFETQRYIATMAAGSRQQSRFIAMMSDYGRTTELVAEAQNSAGASQRQFEKTQDSMAAKLQRLENAWNQFLMGLANNEILKGAVDTLTFIVEGINKIIDAISGGNGLIKSITSLVGVVGALKLGRGLFNKTGAGGIFGGLFGQNKNLPTKETITETKGPGDSIIRTIIKEPLKEGEQAGQQAGTGFIAGFKRATNAKKDGAGLKGQLGAMFTTGEKTDWKKKNPEKIQGIKTDYLAEAWDKNQEKLTSGEMDFEKINAAYDKVIQKGGDTTKAAQAANKAIKEMGGSLVEVDGSAQVASQGIQASTLDMNAMGQAAMGAGALLGGLSAIFSALEMEEEAEAVSKVAAVFMGLGTVMSTLSSIAPMLGMSFTTAGVQITTAGVTSQLAWWWVFLIIAAVAVLIGLVIALVAAVKKNSLESRMKAAAQATEDAKEAAEKAKQAYDDLFGARDEYKELQNSLEGLTKGTEAWKQALLEANSQVLELLTTYPELAKYISRGEDGQLTISAEGWDEVLKNQERSLKNAQRNVMASQMNETRLKLEQAKTAYHDQAKDLGIHAGAADIIFEAFQEEGAELFKLNEDGSYSEALYDLELETGYSVDTIYDMIEALSEYDMALNANRTQLKAQAEATLTAGASQTTLDYEYGEDVISAVANTMTTDAYAKREKELAGELYGKDGSSESKNNAKFQELAKEYGVTNEMIGDDLEDLKTLYAAMAGIAKDEIPDGIAKDKKRLAEEIGKMQASKEYTGKIEDFRGRMQQNLSKDNQRIVASLISGDSSNLTIGQLKNAGQADIASYAKQMGYQSTDEMGEALGYKDSFLKDLSKDFQKKYIDDLIKRGTITQDDLNYYANTDGSINYDALISLYGSTQISAGEQLEVDTKEKAEQMEKSYNDAIESITSKTGLLKSEMEELFNNSSIGTVEGIAQQISGMSEENAKAYVQAWNDTMENSNLGEGQKKQLENYLSTVDWSNMSEAVEAMDYMQSLGMNPDIIENYWNVATSAAGAYVSSLAEALQLTERIQGKMANVNNIIKRLSEGTATYEDVMEMVNAGVDISKFQLTPEGWKASEADTAEAAKALKRNYAQQAANTEQAHNETLQAAYDNGWDGISRDKNGNFTLNSEGFGLSSFTSVDDNGNLVAGKIDWTKEGTDLAMIQALGEEARFKEGEETAEEYHTRVQKLYEDYINLLNTGDESSIVLAKQTAMAEAAQYTTDEAVALGHSDESVRYSMMNEASESGLDVNEVVAYAETLRDVYNLEQRVADQIAIRNAKMNQGVQELADNYDDWAAAIEAGPGNPKYASAVNSLRATAGKLLGTTEGLSDEWLTNEKNMALFERAAKGDTKALEELQKSAAKETIVNMDLDNFEQNKDIINGLIDDMMAEDLEFGATLDTSSFGSALYDILEASGATVDEINAAFGKIGWEPEITYEEMPLSEAQQYSSSTEQEIMVPDGVDENGVTKYKKTTVGAAQAAGTAGTTMVKVPVIGDNKGAKGSNFSTVKESMLANTTFSGNIPDVVTPSAPSGGGGGSKKKENPYDEFYNSVQKLNAELRKRNKLEREYGRLLEKANVSAQELAELNHQQMESLQKEKETREWLLEQREKQMGEIESEYNDMSQYASYNEQDGTIEIDWEAIDALYESGNEDDIERLKEYISKLEEQIDLMEEQQDALNDIEDQVKEMQEETKQNYLDFRQQVYDAVVQDRQEQIDKLSEINDSINDTNSQILDSMQKQIDEYRQNRDNEKTEEEIADKQRRLAYLQQDTSGANALEIMQLQKEIDEAQEDYTDTLIDQKISELQQQNDEAAEQRQHQIDLMQAQLDQDIDSGEIWEDINALLENGIDESGLVPGTELERLLQNAADFDAMGEIEQMLWLRDLNSTVAQIAMAIGATDGNNLFHAIYTDGEQVDFTDQHGNSFTGTMNENGDVIGADGTVYGGENFTMDASGNVHYQAPSPAPENPAPEEPSGPVWDWSEDKKPSKATRNLYQGKYGDDVKNLQHALNRLNYNAGNEDKSFGPKTHAAVIAFQKDHGLTQDGNVGPKTRQAFKAIQFKTGGLADFTGPAWLDGTKTKPEYILNAEQTKAFFTLVDVLSSLKTPTSQSTQNTGDSTYDIDINVESIGSDYDVEQLAEVVKRMINDDARYRNNNTISNMR